MLVYRAPADPRGIGALFPCTTFTLFWRLAGPLRISPCGRTGGWVGVAAGRAGVLPHSEWFQVFYLTARVKCDDVGVLHSRDRGS
jgi:hypothetical protein